MVTVSGHSINYDKLPTHLRAGMERYIEAGILPGSFLQACISNDLIGAVTRAGPEELGALPSIMMWLQWEVSVAAWGSQSKMLAWRNSRVQDCGYTGWHRGLAK